MSKTEKIWLSVMLSIVLAVALASATEDVVVVALVSFFFSVSAAMFLTSD